MASKKYTKLITIDVIQLQEDYFKISFVFNDEISLHVDMQKKLNCLDTNKMFIEGFLDVDFGPDDTDNTKSQRFSILTPIMFFIFHSDLFCYFFT